MYRPLRHQDRLAVMYESAIAFSRLLAAEPPAPRQTTLSERIQTTYYVKRAPLSEAHLAERNIAANIFSGRLVAGQNAATVAAFCESEGWSAQTVTNGTEWRGTTGRAKLWNDGSIMFILPA